MDLKEKYKSLYGRNPRKDWDDARILEAILAKEPDFEYELEPVVTEPEPVVETPQVPTQEAQVVEQGTSSPPSKGIGRSKVYRVFKNGEEMWWTANVIKYALKEERVKNTIEFPENTDYQSDAKLNKCKSC